MEIALAFVGTHHQILLPARHLTGAPGFGAHENGLLPRSIGHMERLTIVSSRCRYRR